MDVITAIEKRREITHFKSESIPQQLLETLIRSLYLAPSGNNLPSREYILVTDRTKLQALAPTSPYMKWLEEAAAAIVIISEPQVSKYWLQDASIAGGFAWLTAVSLGLGAAWGAVYHAEDAEESERRENYAREQLGIPDTYRVVAIIGLGYPSVEPAPKEMVSMDRVVHMGQFGHRQER
ncbi:nitroreductase family protein [Marinicrinis lubricantis]|uniref:Nitroreductase family protein n=1 Tax=Marinicrinis lubricantis TaxID=2086470 RepID=A0ABW1IRK5_9BACL